MQAPAHADRVASSPLASPLTRAAELTATYGLAAFVLTLPLEFTAAIFHQQLSRLVLLALGIAYGYLLIVGRRKLSLPRLLSLALLAAFIAVSLVSWAATRAPHSLNSVLDIALYPIVALLVINIPLDERDHRRAWNALLVSGAAVAVLGFVLYVEHLHIWSPNVAVTHRLNITFADPNITARFLTLATCAAVLMFSSRKSPPWLALAAAISCAVVLPMTWSRSGLALFVVCTVIATIFAFDRRRAVAIAGIALLAFAISTTVNPDTRQRASEAMATAATAVTGQPMGTQVTPIPGQEGVALEDNRVYLVAAGLKMFADHPLVGVGFGGYQNAMLTAYRSFLPQGYTDSVSHTSLVTVLAEQGVLGALLLILFLLALARETWLSRRREKTDTDPWPFWSALASMLVIPILFFSQFEARFLQEPYLWLALGMFYSARLLAGREAARNTAAIGPAARTAEAA